MIRALIRSTALKKRAYLPFLIRPDVFVNGFKKFGGLWARSDMCGALVCLADIYPDLSLIFS